MLAFAGHIEFRYRPVHALAPEHGHGLAFFSDGIGNSESGTGSDHLENHQTKGQFPFHQDADDITGGIAKGIEHGQFRPVMDLVELI